MSAGVTVAVRGGRGSQPVPRHVLDNPVPAGGHRSGDRGSQPTVDLVGKGANGWRPSYEAAEDRNYVMLIANLIEVSIWRQQRTAAGDRNYWLPNVPVDHRPVWRPPFAAVGDRNTPVRPRRPVRCVAGGPPTVAEDRNYQRSAVCQRRLVLAAASAAAEDRNQ